MKQSILEPDISSGIGRKHHLVMIRTRQEARRTLLDGVLQRQPIMVLIGESGVGKTTVLRQVRDAIPAEQAHCIELAENPANADALRMGIACCLGCDQETTRRSVDLQQLDQLINDKARTAGRLLLIFDEAQDLSSECLEQLCALCEMSASRNGNLQIIFAARPSFWEILQQAELRTLRRRITVRSVISSAIKSSARRPPASLAIKGGAQRAPEKLQVPGYSPRRFLAGGAVLLILAFFAAADLRGTIHPRFVPLQASATTGQPLDVSSGGQPIVALTRAPGSPPPMPARQLITQAEADPMRLNSVASSESDASEMHGVPLITIPGVRQREYRVRRGDTTQSLLTRYYKMSDAKAINLFMMLNPLLSDARYLPPDRWVHLPLSGVDRASAARERP